MSDWMNIGTPHSVDSYSDGSPLDSIIFGILILSNIVILVQRRINWGEIFRNNLLLCFFLLYCLISILWSDYPVVSFKRWFKLFGTLSTAMVIITTEHPYEAFGAIIRRLAFWSLPMSVLFIRYYPNMSRRYHMGIPYYSGVTTQKNSLGTLCLLTGMYFIWDTLYNHRQCCGLCSRRHSVINIIFIILIGWLLYTCNSITSQLSLLISFIIFLVGRLPAVAKKPGKFVAVGILFLTGLLLLELLFGVKDTVLSLIGRDANLTSRVPIWIYLNSMVEDPIFGTGYEIFWAGERMARIWDKAGFTVITAHNGYLDIYLNIGIVGLSLLLLCIAVGAKKATEYLYQEYAYGVLRISAILVAVIYNWSESGFKPLSNMLLLLLIGIIEINYTEGLYQHSNLDRA